MYSTSASVMKRSLGSQPVEEFFLAKGPSSPPEVRGLVIHDIKEVESVRQKKVQEEGKR